MITKGVRRRPDDDGGEAEGRVFRARLLFLGFVALKR